MRIHQCSSKKNPYFWSLFLDRMTMDNSNSRTVSLIWNIADDMLRDVFLRGQYREDVRDVLQNSSPHNLAENEADILALDAQSQGFIKSLFENS